MGFAREAASDRSAHKKIDCGSIQSRMAPRRAEPKERLMAAIVAGGALALLVTAWLLQPSGEGHGTHEKLGLPACAWVAMFDRPCPTCGMTTAYAHAASGDLPSAFRTQPLGATLSVVTAAVFWLALHVALFGSRLGVFTGHLTRPAVLWTGLTLLLLAWGYKLLTWDSGIL